MGDRRIRRLILEVLKEAKDSGEGQLTESQIETRVRRKLGDPAVDPEKLTGAQMRRKLLAMMDDYSTHCIAQTRALAETALSSGVLREGMTFTFADEADDDAYCFGRVTDGKLVVEAKTRGYLDEEDRN